MTKQTLQKLLFIINFNTCIMIGNVSKKAPQSLCYKTPTVHVYVHVMYNTNCLTLNSFLFIQCKRIAS